MSDSYLLRRLECVDCGETQPLRVDPYTGSILTGARCELCRDAIDADLWERSVICD